MFDWMKWILAAVIVASLIPQCFSQLTSTTAKSRDQERRALQQAWRDLQRKDPAAWAKQKADLVFDAQQTLAKFGYGTLFTAILDERTRDALRSYQRRNGLPVTGDVDGPTWFQLQDDSSALEPHMAIGPLYVFLDSDWDNFVRVEGAWLEQGKKPDANTPFTSAVVECSKSAHLCVAANSDGSGYIKLEWFDIERWDQYEIATQPNDLLCGRETLRITRPDKTLLAINTGAYKNVEACTNLFGSPGQESVSRLDDFQKVLNARLRALRVAQDRIKLISPEAKKLLDYSTDHSLKHPFRLLPFCGREPIIHLYR